MDQKNITKHKQIILEFLENYQKQTNLPSTLIIEIVSLVLQESRTKIALSAHNKSDGWKPLAIPAHNCNDNIVGESPKYFCGVCGRWLN